MLTEDGVLLAVFLVRVGTDERAEVEVHDLALVPVRVDMSTPATSREKQRNARVHELAPALLALRTLHPVLVELEDLVVRGLRHLGERAHSVLVDLVVHLRELEILRVDLLKQVPVRLRAGEFE
jgi:hypothetical protein